MGVGKALVVDWCWISLLSSLVLLRVFACCTLVQRTVSHVSAVSGFSNSVVHSLYALLCPLQILLHVLCGSHSIGKVHACAGQSSLSQCLQFEEFAMFGVELAGSAFISAQMLYLNLAIKPLVK